MRDQTKTILAIGSSALSVTAIGYAIACHLMVMKCNADWNKDISVAIEKAKAEQQVKNDAFAKFVQYIGEQHTYVSGKVAVLEAKNIARGE